MQIKDFFRRILSLAIIFGLGEACYYILREMNESNLRRALDFMIYNVVAVLLLVMALVLIWTVATRLLGIVSGNKLPGPGRENAFVWFEVVLSLVLLHIFFVFYTYPIRRFDPRYLLGILIAWGLITLSSFFLLRSAGITRGFRKLSSVLTICALVLSVSILVYNGVTNRPGSPTDSGFERPNVLLITIDTLRADALSCYGHTGSTSPNIDRLAAQGALFRNNFSPSSWTYPSMASLITSVPPPTHAVDVASLSIRETFTTMAEVLQANGYYTGAIIAHPVLSSRNGYAQGFHYFDVIDNDLPANFLAARMTQFALVLGLRWRPSIPERSVFPALSFSDSRIFYFKTRLYATAREITDAAVDFLEEMPEAPFFLHLHYFDPHGPYLEHPLVRLPDFSFETQESMPRSWELYQEEVTYLDQHIGRFLDHLEKAGLREDTYIILTADHGEAFLEHDLFFHGNNLHVEEVKVPLMISGPGIAAGRIVETLSTLTDLGPTITDFAGIPRPESFTGTSLESLLHGTDEEERMVFSSVRFNPVRQAKHVPQDRRREAIRRTREEFGENPRDVAGYLLAVRTNDRSFHCLTDSEEGESARMLRLYDIEADPREMSDLSSVEVEKTDFLKESLLEWYRRNRVAPDEETSIEEQEKLRALGYIF